MMDPIYTVISWILLRWHWVWDHIIPGNDTFLGTTWDWVLAIVFLVVTVRIVLFPIFVKQIKSQRAMQTLAPKVRELQAKHKGDPQTLREEMMKLYQTEKVNPLMGCLPLFLQIPVFFGLFHVLRYINPLGDAAKTLYGWTEAQFHSAAAAQLFTAPIPGAFNMDATRIAALGGAHASAAKIVAALLVLIMMLTTFMTQRQMIMKTGWQQEPQQRLIQKLMLYGIPVSLLLSGWAFPIGVIIYWVTQNIISLLQQQWVLRKYPPLVTAQAAAPKTARERAAAAAKKQPGALARFLLVLPPPAKADGATVVEKRGWLARLRSDNATDLTASEPIQRSMPPRPGAKPRAVPSSPTPRASEPVDDAAATDDLVDDVEQPPAPRRPAKAAPPPKTPAPGARPARPVGTTPGNGARSANGSTSPNGAKAGSAPVNGAAPAGSDAKGTAAGSSGSGQARPAPRKATPAKAGARKSGQTGRKGSGRR